MASEFVGGALLSSFIDPALDRLDSPDDIVDYFKEKKLDFKLLRKLKSQLMSFNVVMDDAENRQYIDTNVSRWLRTVKDVVFDVDDLLDEINTEVSMSKLMLQAESQIVTTSSVSSFDEELPLNIQNISGWLRLVKYVSGWLRLIKYVSGWLRLVKLTQDESQTVTTTSLSSFDKELPSRIQDIIDILEFLASEKDILGLVKATGAGVGMVKYVSQRVPATSLVDEAAICGRDYDKEAIIDSLLSEDDNGSSGNNLAVISIVGMGGMGKTTLAQLVYNDTKMDDEFQLKAWVCVSEDFDIARVTRTILKELKHDVDDSQDLNSLQVKLKEKLSGKHFLLVLDDVWEEDHLNWVKLRFPFVHGARGSKILVTTRSEKVALAMRYAHLHQLKQLSEEQSWLLFAECALCDSKFEEIGRNIIKKCNGLPLALKAIGSLLYNESSTEEWNRILNSEIWDSSNKIIPALRLSYQYLPPLLKRCFAYCSLIPKDYHFTKDWLVELWMSENFLQVHQPKKGMKELGDQFFNDLLLRSFFQKSSSYDGQFVMHDLVNDLATFISREFCLRLEKEDDAKVVSKMTRHISCTRNYWDNSEQFEAINKPNKLRTLIAFPAKNISSRIINNLLGKCKSLRVLSLCSNFDLCDDFCRSYPKHLRYLELCTQVKKLPASICLLYNLETLYLVRCCYLKELPPLGILPSLKKLSIKGNAGIKRIGGEFYGNNSSSAAVPYPSLQFLQFEGMYRWEEWDCQNASRAFPCLQQLIIESCRKLKGKLPEHLPSLLKLQIMGCLQLVGPLPRAPTIQEIHLQHCGNLQLEFQVSNTCLETPNVEFQICHPLNFLHKLVLSDTCSTLEALPLDLFPKLKRLRLWDCKNLERLDGSITSLIDLDICDCPKLVLLTEGMQIHFPSLTQLLLWGCPEMDWPEGGLPSSLEILEITDSPKLVASQMKWDLHNYTSLTVLLIANENYKMVEYKGSLPPNLKTLNYKDVGRPSS